MTDQPDHLNLARESLRDLLNDERLPDGVRDVLSADYEQVQAMLDKLENGHIHIAVYGRVSTGKSSLLNALIGERKFSVSPLHGETQASAVSQWHEEQFDGVYLIDTPGINEARGEARENLAKEVSERVDLILFVVDSDLTAAEYEALKELAVRGRPITLVLNKSDLYSQEELHELKAALIQRVDGLIPKTQVVVASADPRQQRILRRDADGQEREEICPRAPELTELKLKLVDIIDSEGMTLAALNASMFASDLSDKVGQRILDARHSIAERITRSYCLAKGAAVALNPLPVVDLLAAAVIDLSMIVHLSKVYGLPLTKQEAGSLVRVIAAEAAGLMGTVWAVHFVSSAFKAGTGGLSTVLTATAQGAVAYYSTYVVGKVADEYLAAGKSWGSTGPKQVVTQILDSIDRDSILRDAREEIRARLQMNSSL